jgi:G:T/U-mismatch repair DNA glycosylase
MIVNHKFKDHRIASDTKILVIGTFHPETSDADFFYGRIGNGFWMLLPLCFGESSLYKRPIEEKFKFMDKNKVDFVDIVSSLKGVEKEDFNNYEDAFVNAHIKDFNNGIIDMIDNIKNLEAVYFTRKSFDKKTNRLKEQIFTIRNHCFKKKIRFCFLGTPSRAYGNKKIHEWVEIIAFKKNCD